MVHRLLSGGMAVAIAAAVAVPGIARAAAAPGTPHRPASAALAAPAAQAATSVASSPAAVGPGANVVRSVDGVRTVVPEAGPDTGGTPRPIPSGPVLFVDGAPSSGCSDTASGAGTQAVPFCTLQAAANVVVAGDTVLVTPYVYSGFSLTAQGTASAPITFESSIVPSAPYSSQPILIDNPSQAGAPEPAHALDVEDSSYVDLEGFRVNETTTSDAVRIDASQHITVNDFMDWVAYLQDAQPAPDIHITGDSSYVAVTRASEFNTGPQPQVQVDAGGTNDTIADNAFEGGTGNVSAVSVAGTPNTEITGNTVTVYSATAISLTGNSPDSTVENNIMAGYSDIQAPRVEVGTGATDGTVLDYNVVRPTSTSYQWGATGYATTAALHSATGQGAHDLNINPDVYISGNVLALGYDSAGIDDADADAPGEQATDIDGQSCVDDPSYPVTGAGTPAYCSRGSYQFQDPLDALETATATGSMSVTVDATKSHGLHGIADYSFDFGDSSAPVVNTTGTATHTYAHSGTYSVTVTVTDSTGATSTSTAASVRPQGADFAALAPVRVLDTRTGTGTGTAGAVRGGAGVTFPVPASVAQHGDLLQAVALNVTVTGPTGSGFVGVSAGTSSLNYTPGQTVAAAVIAPVWNNDGTLSVTLYNSGSGTVQVIADMSGFFADDSTDGYQPISPARLMDTRSGVGGSFGPLTSAQPDVLSVAGADDGAIPSSGVTAVAVNLTLAQTSGVGQVTAYPDGTAEPGTSNINYRAGQVLSNFAIIPVGQDGKIDFADSPASRTQLIVDVVGYFDTAGGSAFVAADPYRDIDTRSGNPAVDCNPAKGALGSGAVLTTNVVCPTGAEPPTSSLGHVTAVAVNTTVTATTSSGYLTVYPAGGTPPTTSNLNWTAGQTVPNLTFAGTGKAGAISFLNAHGSTQLVVDVYGYFCNS